jgi:hypothetical protein
MSASAIMTAALSILQSIVQDDRPPLTVYMGPPRVINDDRLAYLYHDGSSDYVQANSHIRRTHIIPIHLLLLATADDMQTELDMLDYHDQLTGAFYANHTLGGTAATTTLKQRDGENGTVPMYMAASGKEYRQRWWQLEAIEALSLVFR